MNLGKVLINKYRDNRELSQSFIWRLVQIISKQGTSALMFFIGTYFLTKGDMGIYNYISAAITLLVVFSDFGISTSASRYTALYNTVDKDRVKRVFFNSFLIIFSVSLIVLAIVITFRNSLFSDYYNYLLFSLPMVFIAPMTSLLDGIYRGLKKFKKLAIVSMLNSFVGIASSLFFVTHYGIIGALVAQVIYFSVYSIVLFLMNRGYEFKLDKKIIADIGKYSISFGIATLGFYFFSKVNILILGVYNLFEEIATYELLSKIFTVLIIPFSVFGQVLAPYVVEMFSKKRFHSVKDIFKKLLKYLLLINIFFIPLSIGLAWIGVKIFFPEYLTLILYSLFIPISLTYAVAIPVTVVNAGILTSTGHAKLMAVQNVLSGVVNVGLNLLAVKYFGYLGVVWTTFGIQLVSTILLYLVYYSKISKLVCGS